MLRVIRVALGGETQVCERRAESGDWRAENLDFVG